MKNTIPSDLELVTDLNTIRLFPPQIPSDDQISAKEAEYESRYLNDKFVFDAQGNVLPQKKCAWGNRRLARFISRYVHFYKKKSSPDRDFILSRLQSVAAENNVKLPTAAEMDKRQSKKRLIVEQIKENRYNTNFNSTYKAYFDGENVVAYLPGENKSNNREVMDRTKWDDLFELVYPIIRQSRGNKSLSNSEARSDIENELVRQFYDLYDYNDKTETETCPEFIYRKLYNKSAAYAERKKRFHRKKDQVRWTAWWTITYDENKFRDELHFHKKLLNMFRNLCYNKKWRIMGVFEHGEENGRLHFHGFFYIPFGSEIGELVPKKHFSLKDKRWHEYMENTFFAEKFGVNEYEDITVATQSDINAFAQYTSKMLRYMEKGGKIYYSRHIPTEFELELSEKDMWVAFNITCKRKIKRYVVKDSLIARLDTEMRTFKPKPFDPTDPYDNGLLDDGT